MEDSTLKQLDLMSTKEKQKKNLIIEHWASMLLGGYKDEKIYQGNNEIIEGGKYCPGS